MYMFNCDILNKLEKKRKLISLPAVHWQVEKTMNSESLRNSLHLPLLLHPPSTQLLIPTRTVMFSWSLAQSTLQKIIHTFA